jgi:myo-inositol-1(or 4)-monophosphatase
MRAGTVLLDCRQHGYEVQRKAGDEIVTTADRAADAVIREGLQAAFPEDAVYTEEGSDSGPRLWSRRVWIVDPMDSTSSFVAAGDEFAVSIGLAVDGEPVLGTVYLPAKNELFLGGPGLGVFHNGNRGQTSPAATLGGARISVSRKEWLGGFTQLLGIALIPRASMAHKLALLAAGLDDGVVSLKRRKEWGSCAGTALVLGGGGRVTDLEGSDIRFNRRLGEDPIGLIAAGSKLHPQLLHAVACSDLARTSTRNKRRSG